MTLEELKEMDKKVITPAVAASLLIALWASLRFFFGRLGEVISNLVGEIKDNILGENHKTRRINNYEEGGPPKQAI